MADVISFQPIRKVLSFWPEDVFALPAAVDSIGLSDVTVEFSSGLSVSCTGTIIILAEIEFALPLIPGLSVAFMSSDGLTQIPFSFASCGSEFEVGISELSAELRIESSLLKCVEGSAGNWEEIEGPVTIAISGAELTVNDSGEIAFTFDSSAPELSISPFMIGNTGVVIEIEGLQLVLSDDAADDVLPDDMDSSWRGVYIESATVYLPEGLSDILPDDVTLSNFFIGSGGFCGTITGNWTDDAGDSTEPEKTLAGMGFLLKSVAIEFKQNTLVEFALCGKLTLPFFEGSVDVEIGLTNDGDFTVTLASDDDTGLATVRMEGLLTLTLNSLGITRDADIWYVTLGGTLTLDIKVGDQELPVLVVDGLKTSSEGKISVDGGGISLERQTTIKLLNAFNMEIDAIGFGTDTVDGTPMNFVSFSGGIQLTEALPAGVSAKGLQVLWDPAGTVPVKVRCEGIGINFVIKDTLSFSGYVELGDTYFLGSAKISIDSVDLVIDVGVVIGEATGGPEGKFKYLGLIVNTQLPVGIPLASTGLAFYGFGGLFALNMVPQQSSYRYSDDDPIFEINNGLIARVDGDLSYRDAADGFHWFLDWYQDWNQPWAPAQGGLGLGVNTTIGTQSDNGFTFASNLAFVFAYPGPILMLQGKGNLLRDRAKLADTETYPPLFDSLIIFDGGAKSILAALGMQYAIPADTKGDSAAGSILDAGGNSEAFFDFDDPSNWHVYLGEEEEEKRIRATVLSLFKADSYLMLDGNSLKAGASIGIEQSYDFSPVAAVELRAWLSGSGAITWSPQHLQGALDFDGKLSLEIAGIGISLAAEAGVSAQTPTPKELEIDLTVTMDLPWPFDPLKIDIDLAWKDTVVPAAITPLLEDAAVAGYKTTDAWSMTLTGKECSGERLSATRTATDGTEETLYYIAASDGSTIEVPVVDLDARPVLSFNRPMNDTSGVASNASSGLSDRVNDSYTFTYTLTSVILATWDPEADSGAGAWIDVGNLTAYWQATSTTAATQLELYGDGPFSFCRNNLSMASGSLAAAPPWIPYTDSFLASVNPQEWPLDMTPATLDFSTMALKTRYGPGFTHQGLAFTAYSRKTSTTSTTTVFEFSSLSAYPGGGICLPIIRDPVAVLRIDFGGEAQVTNMTFGAVTGAASAEVVAHFADGSKTRQRFMLPASAVSVFALDSALFKHAVSLEIYGIGAYLQGFSYLSAAQLGAADAISEDAAALLGERAVFEPDAVYRITAVVATQVNSSAATTETLYAHFTTLAPPDDLIPYIERATPEAGTLHYRGYDICFEFNENYMEAMYGSLDFSVVDENGAVATNEDGSPVVFDVAGFGAGMRVDPAYTTRVWLGAVADMGGTVPDLSSGEADDVYRATLNGSHQLPPNKTLDAVLKYAGTTLITHRFRTSRFMNFTALVASVAPDTVWELVTASTDLGYLATLAASGGDGGAFEAAWYDTLGFSVAELPQTLEVARITAAGAVVALYLAFPEALDWARITLVVTDAASVPVTCNVVRSYDGARVLVLLPGSSSVPGTWSGAYTLQFSMRLTNGSTSPVLYQYGSADTEEAAPVTIRL